MDNRPIGVFDSGFGGLTAVTMLRTLLPEEDIIYFGDSGRAPYGGRTKNELRVMAEQNLRFLKGFGVKLVLAACGTVSGSVLDEIEFGDVPLFGVIKPAAEKVAAVTENGVVGVIATQASINSGAYQREIMRCNPGVSIIDAGCPKLVPLVESGRFSPGDLEVEAAVGEYLAAIRDAGADTLLLGCTHYSLLERAIVNFMGDGLKLVSASDEAASYLAQNLSGRGIESGMSRRGSVAYYTSGDSSEFSRIAELLFGNPLESEVKHVPPMPL
jgi:glutamate racemase